MNRTGLPRRESGRPDRASEPVPRITSAAEPLADDIARRTRRYLIQMSIRVVCFIGAVTVQHWSRWLLLAGAVVLPYIAVLLANAGRERGATVDPYDATRALPPAPTTTALPPTSPRSQDQ
ncbi:MULTISPECIES: DUF3099 domain-containing protein [unclassified Actinotalea]|uniref:DUF3099 domain-containing protein n=1 Tax=unclassified Actinotalea TaxID=2638618 RepID=UPI0015F75F01|nr:MULTISPECIES: DUF3099 domain-containing protein [unclassified Actinotalea]